MCSMSTVHNDDRVKKSHRHLTRVPFHFCYQKKEDADGVKAWHVRANPNGCTLHNVNRTITLLLKDVKYCYKPLSIAYNRDSIKHSYIC